MNKIHLMGRLVRDPEVRYIQNASSTAISKFSIAVPRKFKREGEPESDFFNCVSFGKAAELFEKYIKKGTKIIITGRVENNNYMNKEGQKVYGMQVVVEEIEFAESKHKEAEDWQEQQSPEAADDGFMNIPNGINEEMPFN